MESSGSYMYITCWEMNHGLVHGFVFRRLGFHYLSGYSNCIQQKTCWRNFVREEWGLKLHPTEHRLRNFERERELGREVKWIMTFSKDRTKAPSAVDSYLLREQASFWVLHESDKQGQDSVHMKVMKPNCPLWVLISDVKGYRHYCCHICIPWQNMESDLEYVCATKVEPFVS